jgi:hypothetical protein
MRGPSPLFFFTVRDLLVLLDECIITASFGVVFVSIDCYGHDGLNRSGLALVLFVVVCPAPSQ